MLNCLVCLTDYLRGKPGINAFIEQMHWKLPTVPHTGLGMRVQADERSLVKVSDEGRAEPRE